MKTADYSETLVSIYRTTLSDIAEERNLNIYSSENLKSRINKQVIKHSWRNRKTKVDSTYVKKVEHLVSNICSAVTDELLSITWVSALKLVN
jgi:hypothetical protein